MRRAEFTVKVERETATAFAELSGDWNPLHTDADYAAGTVYRTPILHGAFSAGLVSRMAGMYMPGTECLLHSLQLRFKAPVRPPAELVVRGILEHESAEAGLVRVDIADAKDGTLYVEASYTFGRHTGAVVPLRADEREAPQATTAEAVLVTGANGQLGSAVLARVGEAGIALPRSVFSQNSAERESARDDLRRKLSGRPVAAILHCGWPAPDNDALLSTNVLREKVNHFVAEPLLQVLDLARILEESGRSGAMLVLVGSTAADPGRHNFKMPLYSIGKAMLPTVTRALAVELGARDRRVCTVVLDVVDGGMNAGMSRGARVAHTSRSPFGMIPSSEEVAEQLLWLASNGSRLASGSVISLTGGALP